MSKEKDFSWDIFRELFLQNKFDEADKYRETNMPDKIYKFVSLDKNIDQLKIFKSENLNTRKFETIENNKLWLSKLDSLNDPFEYKAIYFDKKTEIKYKYPPGLIEYVLNYAKNIFKIASFTISFDDNMPMWAHYANNHEGFCIEYEVNNPRYLYPISYENNRQEVTKTVFKFIQEMMDEIDKENLSENNFKYIRQIRMFIIYSIIKHKKWTYEDEYRIVFYDINSENNGKLISLNEIGLKTKQIYIGYNCDREHKIELQRIANKLNINCFQMKLPSSDNSFKLVY